MSEFTLSCPACGQHILCDTTHAGTQIACPGCNATIAVPKETPGTAPVAAQTSNPPALPGHGATTPQRNSRLAIASLVCSLSSLITCVGWLPGIICGHLAKSRIRRNPALKGTGLATAGLVLGYSILMLEVGTAAYYIWSFSAAVKHGIANARHDLATNNLIVTQTQSATASNDDEPMEPARPEPVAAANPQVEPDTSGWTSDATKASFPDHPVSGKLHGIDFVFKTASSRNGSIRLRSANGLQLDIYLLGTTLEGHSYDIQPDDDGNAHPHVKMTWNEGGATRPRLLPKAME